MLERAGELVTRDQLRDTLWPGEFVTDNSLDQLVGRLRKTLQDRRPYRVIETVSGHGYRFIADIEPSDTPAETGGGLPVTDEGFTGRQVELATLRDLLGRARLVSLVGPGGVGKTRLARHLAIEARGAGSRAWLCELSDAHSARGVLEAVREGLQMPAGRGQGGAAAVSELCAHIGDVDGLLVLDNAEQVNDLVGPLATELLARLPGLTVLVTSRTRLRLQAEHCMELHPLSDEDAVALLLDLADAVSVGLGEMDETVAQNIVHAVDNMPLALVLAAPRLLVSSPAELHTMLRQDLDWLRSRYRDQPKRHRSLAACVQWSWDLLDEAHRQVAAACSVCRGGFTLSAAVAIQRGFFDDDIDVADIIIDLREASILQGASTRSGPRFSLPGPVRTHARRVLEASGQADAVRRSHLKWALDVGSGVDGDATRRRAALAERENLWAAFDRLGPADHDLLPRCARLLYEVASVSASAPDLDSVVDAAVDNTEGTEHLDALLRRIHFHTYVRRDPDAQQADLQRLRAVDPSGPLDRALVASGEALCTQRPADRARHARQALAAFHDAGEAHGMLRSRDLLGNTLRILGELDEARRVLEAGLDQARRIHSAVEEARLRWSLSHLLVSVGDAEGAAEHARAFRAIADATGDEQRASSAGVLLADAQILLGRADDAAATIATVLKRPLRPATRGSALACQGRALLARAAQLGLPPGDPGPATARDALRADAARSFEDAAAAFTAVALRRQAAGCRAMQALALALCGDVGAAVALHAEVLATFIDLGFAGGDLDLARVQAAVLALISGDTEGARRLRAEIEDVGGEPTDTLLALIDARLDGDRAASNTPADRREHPMIAAVRELLGRWAATGD